MTCRDNGWMTGKPEIIRSARKSGYRRLRLQFRLCSLRIVDSFNLWNIVGASELQRCSNGKELADNPGVKLDAIHGGRVSTSASCLGMPHHLDEHCTSVLRGSDLLEEVDASTLDPIVRLQPE